VSGRVENLESDGAVIQVALGNKPTEAQRVLSAIEAHHAEMAQRLSALANSMAKGAAPEAHSQLAKDFSSYLRSDILPHAQAEETSVYLRAQKVGLADVVETMLFEHRYLRAKIDEFETLSGSEQAAVSLVISEVFSIHAQKENLFILPQVLSSVADEEVSEVLSEIQREFAKSKSAPVTSTIDLRPLPPRARHDVVFSKIQSLKSGDAITVINDHNPKPLFYQIDALWPNGYSCAIAQLDDRTFTMEISKLG
jgi:uncharacterized protein (DUF2249 family)/hemerythrin-like domain-containing protein